MRNSRRRVRRVTRGHCDGDDGLIATRIAREAAGQVLVGRLSSGPGGRGSCRAEIFGGSDTPVRLAMHSSTRSRRQSRACVCSDG
jgi:hypothetical protein